MSAAPIETDVLVVGAGPAGSAAAYVLANAGARVVLADRASFPRDKACGDLVGPRGLRTLVELGLGEPAGPLLGDMVVIGPSGRRLVLPSFTGDSYPGHAVAVRRRDLDHWLRSAALEAGAEPLTGRAGEPIERDGRLAGFVCGGRPVRAEVVIGADGATSHVASVSGMLEAAQVLWAFAVRCYSPEPDPSRPLALPHIVFFEPDRGQPLPGYGWVFPGTAGEVNLGLGVGVLAERRGASEVMRRFPQFLRQLARLGLVAPGAVHALPAAGPSGTAQSGAAQSGAAQSGAAQSGAAQSGAAGEPAGVLGGWLKLGLVGTVPARDNVLLVGDAAGLVNPLQGEGIARALASGAAAATEVLRGPGGAAARYRALLAGEHRRFEPMAVAAHRVLVGHPHAAGRVLRLLTAPVLGPAIAGSWSLLWNDLLEGAQPSRARSGAAAAAWIGERAAGHTTAASFLARMANGEDAPADLA